MGMKVHISQSTKDLLGPKYKVLERGELDVKGKGCMKTYWLEERKGRTQLEPILLTNNREIIAPITTDRRKSLLDATKRISLVPGANNRELTVNAVQPGSGGGGGGSTNNHIEDRRVYSPVTYHDVARRSIANSPVKSVFSAGGGGGARGRGNERQTSQSTINYMWSRLINRNAFAVLSLSCLRLFRLTFQFHGPCLLAQSQRRLWIAHQRHGGVPRGLPTEPPRLCRHQRLHAPFTVPNHAAHKPTATIPIGQHSHRGDAQEQVLRSAVQQLQRGLRFSA